MMLNNGMLHEYSHSTGSYAIPNHPTLQRPGGVAFNSATNVDVNAQVDMFGVSPYTHTSPVEWNFNGFSSAVHSASLKTAGTPRRKRKTNPAQRIAANVRERKRMCSLNSAFDRLRRRVPTFPHEKRLSRIQTLKLAMTYIGFMTEVLTGQDINMYAHQQFGSFTEHLIDNQTW